MVAIKPVARRSLQIAIIEDDQDYSELLATTLQRHAGLVDVISDLKTLEERIHQRQYDVIILDVFLGQEEGLSIIPYLAKHSPHTKIVVLTAFGSIDLAVTAMKQGATNFLVKSMDLRAIAASVVDLATLPDVSDWQHEVFESVGLIGNSSRMKDIKNLIFSLANIHSTILLTGESGTGKEMVAKSLHQLSNRKTEPFIAINCGAIPEQLLESELFGHKRGAFTDAKETRRGIFEICADGTVLLDEIGEMPMHLQVKLLRVLQEKEITPVGSTQSIKINTRIIAATNRNLHEEVQRGRFREDLFYRLNVIHIDIPPLRERLEDVPLLVEKFVREFTTNYAKVVQKPNDSLITRLQFHDWPGNIRELRNAIERGVVLARGIDIQYEDMFYRGPRQHAATTLEQDLEGFFGSDLPEFTEARRCFEKAYLRKVLSLARGNIATASRLAGRYRADIYRLMNKYGLDREGQVLH